MRFNKIVIEGPKDVIQILKARNLDVYKIFWHKKGTGLKEFFDIKEMAEARGILCEEIGNKEFKDLRKTVHSQGIFGLVRLPEYEMKKVLADASFIIVLDNLQDPGNFGTIIRTAALLGVDAVFTVGSGVKLSSAKALRASKGYLYKIPILENVDLEELYSVMQRFGYNIFSADMKGTSYIDNNLSFGKPLCIFMGSEGTGLSKEILNKTKKICIPTQEKESLNVGVSCGILIAEVKRRWM